MGKVFIIDAAKCNGCHSCQIVCKDEHVGNDWSPVARPQPDTGQFWIKMTQEVRGTVPKVKVAYRPHLCMHCDEAPCMSACKVDGALYKRDDGLVIIDAVKCTGCKNCVDSCPYEVIYFNEDLNIAQKCTGCAHLLDKGWKESRCSDACPTLAIRMVEESEAGDLIKRAEVIHPELKTRPRVYYLNLSKKFVAGTIYDPAAREVIIGADVTLTDLKQGSKRTTTTDDFGDFWFEELFAGKYEIKIEAKGFSAKIITNIVTEKDVNLGDISLT